MPIWDFKCPQCGVKALDILSKGDYSLACPKCGQEMEHVLSTFSIRGFPKVPRNHLPKRLGGEWDYSQHATGNIREI